MQYISLLRGINVSGQKKIKMQDLRALYEGLGFKEVDSYIQSGNVVFNTKKSKASTLEKKIALAISKAYGFEVPVMVLEKEEWSYLQQHNPFQEKQSEFPKALHCTILEKAPSQEGLDRLADYSFLPDEFVVDGRYIYVFCPNGYGRTKITNNFFESKLKLRATTRNWRSVNTIGEMLA